MRSVTRYDGPSEVTDTDGRYTFLVSRIRLRLDVRFTVDEANRFAAWQLDKPSWVLNDSTGYWRVEACADRPPEGNAFRTVPGVHLERGEFRAVQLLGGCCLADVGRSGCHRVRGVLGCCESGGSGGDRVHRLMLLIRVSSTLLGD